MVWRMSEGSYYEDEDMMTYTIMTGGRAIAKFLTASDRDLCIEAMREAYDDCVFEPVDEK